MIRTRLSVAFALLSALALGQGVFAWLSSSTAAMYAERKAIASGMEAEYESLGGNKQRLKVWFAEAMLTGNAPPLTRVTLVARMEDSLRQLRDLADRDAAVRGGPSPESPTIATLERNIETMSIAVREAIPLIQEGDPAERWRTVLEAFDRLSGQDMREVIREAILRQDRLATLESARLAAALADARLANIVLAALAVLIGVFAVWYFVTHLQRPFAQLNDVALRFARGELDARSGLTGNDEFGRLGALLDSMATSLREAQARDVDVQRSLDELVAARTRSVTQAHETMLRVEGRRRQFFAEVSHELRTPVTVIRGEADIALRGGNDSAALRESLVRINDAAKDLSSRVQDLLDAARSGSHDYAFVMRPVPLVQLVHAVAEQMQALARYRGVTLTEHYADGASQLRVIADAERLQQAVTTVLDNALRYTGEGGTVELRLVTDEDSVCIDVLDNGPGMRTDEMAQALEPQFRGEASVANPNGAGLGLSIADRIMQAHGGSIVLSQRTPHGLRVQLSLPWEANSA
jgi:signal transduction histidine kinase